MSTDEDPSLRIESFAIINLRDVSPKINKKTFLRLHKFFPWKWLNIFYIELTNFMKFRYRS